MEEQIVAAVLISVTVFGIGGFALGWFAGKRAYKDRMPAMDAEDLNTVDPEALDAIESNEKDAIDPKRQDTIEEFEDE
mgnify:CR=1 FL=1